MANFRIERDESFKLLICRIDDFLNENQSADLAHELRAAIIRARQDFGRLKVLFDNSSGKVLSPASAAILAAFIAVVA